MFWGIFGKDGVFFDIRKSNCFKIDSWQFYSSLLFVKISILLTSAQHSKTEQFDLLEWAPIPFFINMHIWISSSVGEELVKRERQITVFDVSIVFWLVI